MLQDRIHPLPFRGNFPLLITYLVGQGSDQSEYIITNQMKNAGIAITLGTLSWKHGGMVKCVGNMTGV